jgi:heterodisulfide reductase subunit C2
MTEFKFANPPSVFNPSEKDEGIQIALKEAGYNPSACMQCGLCTASCLSGRWTGMRTRDIMKRAVLGDSSILEDPDIWLCTTCYTCFDRCPRDLKVTDAIVQLRNLASARGLINPKHRKTVDILLKTGHAVPINDKIKQIRKELGIQEIPPTIYIYPEDLIKMAEQLFHLVKKEGE